jgi:hypothetical protein
MDGPAPVQLVGNLVSCITNSFKVTDKILGFRLRQVKHPNDFNPGVPSCKAYSYCNPQAPGSDMYVLTASGRERGHSEKELRQEKAQKAECRSQTESYSVSTFQGRCLLVWPHTARQGSLR